MRLIVFEAGQMFRFSFNKLPWRFRYKVSSFLYEMGEQTMDMMYYEIITCILACILQFHLSHFRQQKFLNYVIINKRYWWNSRFYN